MRHSISRIAMLAALLAGTALATGRAEAASMPGVGGIIAAIDELSVVDNVQVYVFGGRRYCWYDDGWNGPGWYWCGYRYNRGFGWGGGFGYRGWRGGFGGRGGRRGGTTVII